MTDQEIQEFINIQFKSFDKKPILFVGSGFSKRYINSPNWENLLKHICSIIDEKNTYLYNNYVRRAEIKIRDEGLSNDNKFPLVGQFMEDEFNLKFTQEYEWLADFKYKYKDIIESTNSYFKLYICDYLKSFDNKTDTYYKEIDSIYILNNRVSNIITTNYDSCIEEMFEKFTVYSSQDEMLNQRISSIGNIFKIHGSITDPDSVVITQADYDYVEMKQKFISSKLLTFFLENPIIFIGYGINDLDIKKILNDIKTCLNHKNEEILSKRLLFIEYTDNPEEQKIEITDVPGIKMTKITLFDYNLIYKAFGSITEAIDTEYLKSLDEKVMQLIQTSNEKVDKVYAESLYDYNPKNGSVAIYIASENSIFSIGYGSIKLMQICEDVLFNNKNYDSYGIIDHSIKDQKARYSNSKLPLYKYLKNYRAEIDPFFTKDFKVIKSLDNLYSRSDRSTNLYLNPKNTLQECLEEGNLEKSLKNIFYCLRSLDITEVKQYMIEIWPYKEQVSSTTVITKIICAIDFAENYLNIY